MMANSNVTIRLDDDLKRKTDELFDELGISLSGGINLFLRQCVRDGGLPFVPTTKSISARESRMEYALVELPEEGGREDFPDA